MHVVDPTIEDTTEEELIDQDVTVDVSIEEDSSLECVF